VPIASKFDDGVLAHTCLNNLFSLHIIGNMAPAVDASLEISSPRKKTGPPSYKGHMYTDTEHREHFLLQKTMNDGHNPSRLYLQTFYVLSFKLSLLHNVAMCATRCTVIWFVSLSHATANMM
jgi:hypothetical protein